MSILDVIQSDLKNLLQIESNLKKSINQQFKLTTLQAKLTDAIELHTEIETKLLEHGSNLLDSEVAFITKASRQAFQTIKNIIAGKTKTKMTTTTVAAFDIKTATAVISHYDGSAENLDAFIDATKLMKELTPADQHTKLIQFIRTRLTGKARLGLPAVLNSVDALLTDVKQRCEAKIGPESILAKLKQLRIQSDVSMFTNEVEHLTNKLKATYIEKQIPTDVANSMATKAGVDTLIEKTTNLETKIILSAGSFSSVTEAIQKLNEHGNRTNTAQVLKFSPTRQERQFGRRPNNQNRQNSSNFQRNRQQSQHQHYQNDRNYRQSNYGNNNRNWRGRNFQSQNHFQFNNQNRHGRLYVAQRGNPTGPQQQLVGGLHNNFIPQHPSIPQFAHTNQGSLGQQTQQQPMISYQNQLTQSQLRQ